MATAAMAVLEEALEEMAMWALAAMMAVASLEAEAPVDATVEVS